MDHSGFMHKYFDWASFEIFVKDLHEEDGDVTVLRDVTEEDRYGAKRQTDIKIIRKSRFHQFVTLVECKRWKEPVSRDRIDVLASSIEALGATNGAIFTTTGFEEGAIKYAKGKGIELYVVRDLTPGEWGLPGRHISLSLHIKAGEFKTIEFRAMAIPLIDTEPTNLALQVQLDPKKALDPDYDLFSVKSGERGPNLVTLLGDVHSLLLSTVGNEVQLFDTGEEATIEIVTRGELDLSKTEFCQLRLPAMAARIEKIGFTFNIQISQSAINIDRGSQLDFAVMVESYVSEKRLIALRSSGTPKIEFQDAASDKGESQPLGDVLQNGSIMSVQCSPWVGLAATKPNKLGYANEFLNVIVETDGRKPRLSLVAIPLPPSTLEQLANFRRP